MEFRILGPLEIEGGDRSLVVLGATKPRALLAVLLLHANEVVSIERLVDELWGERPPATAAKLVQGYVLALRKQLGGDRILTRPLGYRVRVEADELDLHTFERLVALAHGDGRERAAELLQEALTLWRGPALADLTLHGLAAAEVARLNDLRSAALIDRIEAELEDGRPAAQLVGELEGLVAGRPFDERLRRLQMLALYRSGRQAEALHAYADARRTLVDELGLEPGAELQRLERQILQHDPAIDRGGNSARRGAPAPELPGAVRGLPTGTVTFLLTDIEGSTQLLAERGREYADLLAAHRRALRQAFRDHNGVEVDTQGDAFFVAFGRAADAAAAAEDAQRALAGGPVRVRMGLHTGEPVATDEGYVGMDVHRAGRICAAAHGGQILLSQSTRDLLVAEAQDLGLHRLKDLLEPERLYQLGDEAFPPLRTLDSTNLPVQPTPLVGREHELSEVAALLREQRLLTLVGPPGTGKTRLALQLAAEVTDEFEHVWWVPLQKIRDPDLVEPTIAHTVGARSDLSGYLRDRRALLVLDNLEQVIGCAPRLGQLVAGSSHLTLLVTSREPLHLTLEQQYPVPPLPEEDAVALFCTRARAVRPGFAAAGAVADICRRLDGLPLAIELAAARITVLSPEQMLEMMDARLPLLTGGPRDAPARQRTLRATIEWSHDLLTPAERTLFARLAVFLGGCTLEAAVAVCDADLDVLAALVDKSLVRGEDERFGMLDTIHEYAAERLRLSGEEDALRDRHAEHFLALARQLDATRPGPEWYKLVERFDRETANTGVALGRLLDSRPAAALELAFPRDRHWISREGIAERVRVLEEALRRAPDASPTLRARALGWLGHILAEAGHGEQAIASFEASLSLATKAGAEPEIGSALLGLRRYDDALALFRRLGDDNGTARALHRLGLQALDRGDPVQGRKLLEESLALTRTVGDPSTLVLVLHSLADCALDEGVLDEAERLYHESLDIAARTNAFLMIAYCLGGLAAVEARRGRPESAGRLWRAVRAFERESGYVPLDESERSRYERALSSVAPFAPADGAAWAEVLAEAVAYARSLKVDDPPAPSA